jgi:SAM-dependent methyltransferase
MIKDRQINIGQYNYQETYHLGERALSSSVQYVYNALSRKNAKHVLELGCGAGRFAKDAPRNRQWHITGFDINPDAIQTFQSHIDTQGLPDKAIHGDITQLDLSNHDFDAAVSWRVLHTLPKNLQIQLCQAVYEALPPGASFFLSVASHKDWKAEELVKKGQYNPYDINNCAEVMELHTRENQQYFGADFFWEGKLRQLAHASGFELVGDIVEFDEASGYEHIRETKPANKYLIAEFRKPEPKPTQEKKSPRRIIAEAVTNVFKGIRRN